MEIVVDIEQILNQLLESEDTDNDKKITVEDKGSKRFSIKSVEGKSYELCSTYNLAVLLQELHLAKQDGKKRLRLSSEIIFQPPIERISYLIKNFFWDGLTRSIDEENIENALKDTKSSSDKNYIYVPFKDEQAFKYYKKIEAKRSDLNISVVKLPEKLTDNYLQSISGKPGLLVLALEKNKSNKIKGVPFAVPGGRFNEMYGWDSYFESLGLILDGKINLALSMAENFFYEIEHYGKILNANRSYYLNRSQPPFLTSLVNEIWSNLKKRDKSWLQKAVYYCIKEYKTVWTETDRLTTTGLSRFFGSGSGIPTETEETQFDSVLKPFAEKSNMSLEAYRNKYLKREISDPELEEYFLHDRSVRESGHDTSYRLEGISAHVNTVDLNSLLYKYEIDIGDFIKNEFNDRFNFEDEINQSSFWFNQANIRKKLINNLLWDEAKGFFFDYNYVSKKKTNYESATTFYPLWANLITKKQADLLIKKALPILEESGGVAASSERSRGLISDVRPARQWDYPNGWAPHQMMIWKGLENYEYENHAARLAYKWLYTILRNFVDYNGTIPEKYDVVNRSHKVFAEYGNVGTEFEYLTKEGFGWMNASFQVGLTYLNEDLKKKLNNLIPPEWIFEK